MTSTTLGASKPGLRTGNRARPADGSFRLSRRLLDSPLASYYLLMGPTTILLVFGLVMVLSASSVTSFADSGSSFTVAKHQALWILIGVPAMWLGQRTPVRVLRLLGYPLLFASLALLAALLVPGVGVRVSGAVRWIDLPGQFQLQPSEPAKLALVIWGADLLTRKERSLTLARHLLVPLVPVTVVAAALVIKEPDLGTTIVLLLIMLALLWAAGAPTLLFAGLGLATGAIGGLVAIADPYRLQRLTSFTNPCGEKALSAGYQACQGLYALSSGGWWGLGLGASREKFGYLPNQYTDYIFAIIGEELGLLGTLVVLALFGLLAYAGIRIARRATDRFTQLAAAGITAWLIGQALVNLGAVVGLFPITGIPLPMVSFGGSALVPTLFAIGILAGAARREPGAARALQARKARRRMALRGRLSSLVPTGRQG